MSQSTSSSNMAQIEEPRLVVGVDFGTTYFGVSFVLAGSTTSNIDIITNWSDQGDRNALKVPTRISYAPDRHGNANSWGYSIPPSATAYMWMKLLLDDGENITTYDDPTLKNVFGDGVLRLPENKTPTAICSDFLHELYKHIMLTLSQTYHQSTLDGMPIDFWFTIPAVWGDRAQSRTKMAAVSAGFASRDRDTLTMIREPEAAALTALDRMDQNIKAGETLMIVDCGGGTVDITCYKVVRTSPSLQFDEICAGRGGKCGATFIDRNFSAWMTETFGTNFTCLTNRKRGPSSSFMRSFETAKLSFSSTTTNIEIESLDMPLVYDDRYDNEEGILTLTNNEMRSFFDPVIEKVLQIVSDQIANAVDQTGLSMDRLILVGGFGESPYLFEKLEELCLDIGHIALTRPRDCQIAVVKGAAIRGLKGLKPQRVLSPRHYGYMMLEDFVQGDNEAHAEIDPFTGDKYCTGKMTWFLPKNQAMDEAFNDQRKLYCTVEHDAEPIVQIDLYYSNEDDAPTRVEDPAVIRLQSFKVPFSQGILDKCKSKASGVSGRTVFEVPFNLRVLLRGAQGLLALQVIVKGKVIGEHQVSVET